MDPTFQLQPGQQELILAQEAEAARFAEERIRRQLSTEPVDEQEAEALLRQAYHVAKVPPPQRIQWVDGPLQLVALASHRVEVTVYASLWNSSDTSVVASVRAYASAEKLAFYCFFDVYLAPNDLHALACFNELVSGYWLGQDLAIIVRRPKVLSRDTAGHLHSATGRCIAYHDGWGLYAWHGVCVPERVIVDPTV